jgi:divalent metal cation (Fe/Co/Zn/Cd) transporter
LDAELSLADVHSVTEEMENRLRREFVELGRVVIHAEPFKARSRSDKAASVAT